MSKYLQGKFIPTNINKCITPNKCIYRSSWEYKIMRILDISTKVKRWGSEPFKIHYISPLDNKIHRYYPDFYVELLNGKKYVIEVKPHKETLPPQRTTQSGRRRSKKTYINECITYARNTAKWKYAEAFCKKNGLIFKKITENDIFNMV